MNNFKVILKTILNLKFLVGIQVISTIAFLLVLLRLGVLPPLYLGIVAVLFLLFDAALIYVVFVDNKTDIGFFRKSIAKIFSVLLSVVLIIASVYIYKGNATLNEMTGANVQTTRYSVIVLNNDTYASIKDLKNQTIQMCNLNDKKNNVEKAQNALLKKVKDIDVEIVDSYTDLIENLYNGTVEAIFVNEGLTGFFEEEHPTYASDTKVLWSYDITEKIEDISKNVNVTEDAFTIYISGIDTRGPVSTVSRTDVNMLVTVNPHTKQILMTSIPRDYYVPLANSGIGDKLTHSALAGIQNSVETLENFFEIDINYYARVNFTSLESIVNALGGITVNSPIAFQAGDYFISAGDNYMDGAKALAFSRERYNVAGGDGDRVANQQRVLIGILKKAMSPAIITNYNQILASVQGCLETNMSSKDITSFIQMQIDDMASWDIQRQQVWGTGTMMTGGAYAPLDTLYYLLPDEGSARNAAANIEAMVNDEVISLN